MNDGLQEQDNQPKYRRIQTGWQCLKCGVCSENEEEIASASCHDLSDIYG